MQPSVKQVQAPIEKKVENVGAPKANVLEGHRQAERKVRKIAAARSRQEQEHWTRSPGRMAYDERRFGGITQPQQALAQRRHRARIVLVLVVGGV